MKCIKIQADVHKKLVFGGKVYAFLQISLHDALKDDDLVLFGAWGQGGQAFNVRVRRHVLQVMGTPHWFGQIFPTL